MADDNSRIEDERTLAELIAGKGVLSIKDAAKVTLQLVKAVSELHTEGRVHRKICADTVSLNDDMSATLDSIEPEVTLGGIGVDLVPSPPQLQNIPPVSLPAEIKTAQQILTEAGILLDPCQIDFYQLGALLCFMVSSHRVSDYLRSCKAKADVPEMIRPIIDRALGINTKEQFESTEAFIFELEAVISDKPVTEDKPDIPDSIFIEPLSKPETEDQLPFKKIGHYEIVECIGRGGMGDVYKGYEKALDRFVAIKVLPAELARQKDYVKRFHSEATAIAKIDHPNIVRIYYSGEDHDRYFFAMQYVDGESLADLLAHRKKLSTSEALPIIEQCLAGIGAAHKRGLIHRDIKPGNVLLDRHSRRALVADFGVAKSAHAGTQLTITGTIVGTADYIAPEQARGSEVDCRTDLYAMGVLMYQMLSGQLPFDAKSATSMMFQHAYEPPPPLSEVAPQVPEKLAEIVMKLMAKDADDRFQSADDVLTALRDIDLEDARAAGTSQTCIIAAPRFYDAPELPANLLKLTGKDWPSRLRNRIIDFFGTHAPQVIEYMQTTCQQVDGAVAEYQRRRDKLAKLAEEAETAAAELEAQAKASRRAAQVAGERVETANNTTAKQLALKEKQESEQTAAELAQLAAEQAEQSEEISLRLAKVNAKLVTLKSQQNALNARLKSARAQLNTAESRPNIFSRKRIFFAGIMLAVVCIAMIAMYYISYPTHEITRSIGSPFSSGMPLVRQLHTATRLKNGKILVTGGTMISGPTVTCELYDQSSDAWSVAPNLNEARAQHDAVLLNDGRVLVVGGRVKTSSSYKDLSSAEIYNPSTNAWTVVGNSLNPRHHGSLTVLDNGFVLFAGGYNDSRSFLNTAELFDPKAGVFTPTGNLNVHRNKQSAVKLPDGRVLVIGGYKGGGRRLTSAEIYDPSSKTWKLVAGMGTRRYCFSAVLLNDGKVLAVAGGTNGRNRLNSSEIYDPVADTWTPAGKLHNKHKNNVTIKLSNGRIWTLGELVTQPEIYDPVLDVWSLAKNTLGERSGFTATLLDNGDIIVIGGHGDYGYQPSVIIPARDSAVTPPLPKQSKPITTAALASVSLSANIPNDAILFRGHSYKPFVGGWSWDEARARAEHMGGHLIVIDDEAEQTFFSQTVRFGRGAYWWIGLRSNYITHESVTGQPVKYAHFGKKNPVARMGPVYSRGGVWSLSSDPDSKRCCFVVEWDSLTVAPRSDMSRVPADAVAFRGHKYKILGPSDWLSARNACEKIGGYLVCIESAAEDQFLTKFVSSENATIWLGAHFYDNRMCWVNGSTSGYSNWSENSVPGFRKNEAVLWTADGWITTNADARSRKEQYVCEWGE